jgi:sirohydrochlorin cobaltochelatase
MMLRHENQRALEELELRVRSLLPEQYQDSYEDVQPVSMGSAGLQYGRDGKVAWDEVWESFCDLAMAGGPPHKGKLLEPASAVEIGLQPDRYAQVLQELCRGIEMVANLPADPATVAGWVRLDCESENAAEWLVRAIVMENVSARHQGTCVDLPAGPGYRVEKEIKNVITAVAKTCHYWFEHMGPTQKRTIGNLFTKMSLESPLIQPAIEADGVSSAAIQSLRCKIAEGIHEATGRRISDHRYSNWIGMECPGVKPAIWMMRALVTTNVLSRREETVLFVPVNPLSDPNGATVVESIAQIYNLAVATNRVPS